MTWTQVAVLGFLLFGVGWVVEARLERILKELIEIRERVGLLPDGQFMGSELEEIRLLLGGKDRRSETQKILDP